MMTPLERTQAFIDGKPTDRPPCHPIIMRWAARLCGVPYRDFCVYHTSKCEAMIRSADRFDLDWVTTLSDPYAEASAFGLQIEYPENDLPIDKGGRLPDLEAVKQLRPYQVDGNARLENRIEEIATYHAQVGDRLFIVGWVEGPIAEYADLRGLTEAAMDLYDDPDTVAQALDVIVDAVLPFIARQIEAGAHCIGIGDAFCSQIGPDFYRQFAWERERRMIDHIHALGARAKLHICGNTHALLPDMIRTGADIIDVDHLVPSLADHAHLLGPGQVFSGKADPVRVLQNGTPASIIETVQKDYQDARGRCIVSAGCEITPDTTAENMRALSQAATLLGQA